MDKLKQIIKDLKGVCEETELIPSDDILFDCSVRILNTNLIQDNRQGNRKPLHPFPIDILATEKQINLLKRLGLKLDYSKLTKQEAFKIINERMKKEKL